MMNEHNDKKLEELMMIFFRTMEWLAFLGGVLYFVNYTNDFIIFIYLALFSLTHYYYMWSERGEKE